ncbi:MAG TPA: NAD(P)-binding domain-containing protein, partial [Ornithinibacter sp.]|nr:NAD(P)-binding domain-containing protein [Ornithinibacter sp.]
LEAYAAHHRLDLRLGSAVTRVERLDRPDGPDRLDRPARPVRPGGVGPGRWVVHLEDGSTVEAAHVVVATGYNHTPVTPDWPGLAGFTGDVVLARDYRNGRPYAGRDVLVVGTGNTGTEIATDLAEHGALRVWLAVRTPPHILPRSRMGWPAQGTGILVRRLPPRLVDRVAHVLAVVQEPDLTAYGMPKAGTDLYSRVLVGRVPVQDVGIVAAIRSRRVEPVAAVASFDGPDVVLADGRRLEPDAVVVATGYLAGLEPLVGHLGVLDRRGLPVVHGAHEPPGAAGLWFTGFTNPISGMLRELRIDAERIAAEVSRAGASSRG